MVIVSKKNLSEPSACGLESRDPKPRPLPKPLSLALLQGPPASPDTLKRVRPLPSLPLLSPVFPSSSEGCDKIESPKGHPVQKVNYRSFVKGILLTASIAAIVFLFKVCFQTKESSN